MNEDLLRLKSLFEQGKTSSSEGTVELVGRRPAALLGRVAAPVPPGHTPGGTSWSWRSCEGARCVDIVYADSLGPVSADGFKFTTSPLLKGFEQAYAALEGVKCDILLTPHPGFAQVLEKLAAREAGKADAFIDPGACKAYAASGRRNLAARVATESGR
jgi:metallo-beta-lactamase class B